jgi:DNA-binding NtrC family response regulator
LEIKTGEEGKMLDMKSDGQPEGMKAFRVLVVDDDLTVRDLFKDIMNVTEHEIICVEDGCKALEKIKEEHFDIVFVDMIMPGMNGLETFKAIKEVSSELPVVMMTGFAIEERMKEALKLGAFDYLYKPFDASEGRQVISREFEKKNLKPSFEK